MTCLRRNQIIGARRYRMNNELDSGYKNFASKAAVGWSQRHGGAGEVNSISSARQYFKTLAQPL